MCQSCTEAKGNIRCVDAISEAQLLLTGLTQQKINI